MKAHAFLDRQAKPTIILAGFAVILLIGAADYLTGHRITPAIFYILPIFTVTWFAGKRAGIAAACLSAAIQLAIELRLGEAPAAIPYLNLLARLGVFLVVVYLLSTVKKLHGGLASEVEEKTASLVRKIEEHERAEREIAEQKAFLENVIESLPHPFYVIDADDYTILSANAASGLRGATGVTCYALTHRQERPCSETGSLCPLEAVKATGKPVTVEHIHYDADGKPKAYEVHGVPVTDADGKVIQMIEYALDITERRLAEQEIEDLNTTLAARAFELETANRELEAFNYTVSHDLRRPLTIINGYSQIIQEHCCARLSGECREYLREISDETMRMNRLIDTLLDFSRIMRTEMKLETIDLSGMAKRVAAELKSAEPERRVEFLIAEGITVTGDANLLLIALENLLGNAWKYTGQKEEGVIEVGTTVKNGKSVVFVRDNGMGFDMAFAEKIFLPFQRLPGAEAFRGSGIGLATVERIVRRHGGDVWAEGEKERGATFFFALR
jgi:signal transduction histidine kinase